MDPTFATIIKYAAIIVICLLVGWFILEVVDRVTAENYAPITEIERMVAG
jgi:hypothetical protein